MTTKVLFWRRLPDAKMPTKASEQAAGFDVYAVTVTKNPHGPGVMVDTGLNVAFPAGYVLTAHMRSGLALKQGFSLKNSVGIIDADYRGELILMLQSSILTDEALIERIKPGDRIGQLILLPLPDVEWVEVAALEDLPASVRGEAGFGSTGVR